MDKVQTGQQLTIKATTWNSFIDAAEYVKNVKENQKGNSLKGGLYNGIVLLKNGEQETIPQNSALMLTDLLSIPHNNDSNKITTPVFMGKTATDETADLPFAITLSPIAPNKIGRAIMLGVISTKATIINDGDEYLKPIPNNKLGAMQSSSTGNARIIWKGGVSGEQPCIVQLGGASSGGATAPKYNGYFTIKNISTEELLRVVVTYGWRWDWCEQHPEEKRYTDSFVCVNDMEYKIEEQIFNINKFNSKGELNDVLIAIHFTAPIYDEEGKEEVAAKIVLETLEDWRVPEPTETDIYYQIGRIWVYLTEDKKEYKISIIQDHIAGKGNGEPQIWWMTHACN